MAPHDDELLDSGWDAPSGAGREALPRPPDPAGGDAWHVRLSDDKVESLASAEIVRALRAGRLSASTLVARSGMSEWIQLGQVPLFRLLALRGAEAGTQTDARSADGPAEPTAGSPSATPDRSAARVDSAAAKAVANPGAREGGKGRRAAAGQQPPAPSKTAQDRAAGATPGAGPQAGSTPYENETTPTNVSKPSARPVSVPPRPHSTSASDRKKAGSGPSGREHAAFRSAQAPASGSNSPTRDAQESQSGEEDEITAVMTVQCVAETHDQLDSVLPPADEAGGGEKEGPTPQEKAGDEARPAAEAKADEKAPSADEAQALAVYDRPAPTLTFATGVASDRPGPIVTPSPEQPSEAVVAAAVQSAAPSRPQPAAESTSEESPEPGERTAHDVAAVPVYQRLSRPPVLIGSAAAVAVVLIGVLIATRPEPQVQTEPSVAPSAPSAARAPAPVVTPPAPARDQSPAADAPSRILQPDDLEPATEEESAKAPSKRKKKKARKRVRKPKVAAPGGDLEAPSEEPSSGAQDQPAAEAPAGTGADQQEPASGRDRAAGAPKGAPAEDEPAPEPRPPSLVDDPGF